MIGTTIRRLRKEKGLSVNKLAKKTGVSPAYISKIENGKKNNLSAAILCKLAEGLECDYSWLLDVSVDGEDTRLRLEVRYMHCKCSEIFLIEYYEEKLVDNLICPFCGKREVEEIGVIEIVQK